MPPALTGGAGSDLDDDAQPAFVASGAGADADEASFSTGSVFGEDDGPPLEMLEAQMGGEVSARDRASANTKPVSRRAADEDDDAASVALPELDTLVGRLPPEVRETLDELFRARFVTVKRPPKKVFKPLSAKADMNTS